MKRAREKTLIRIIISLLVIAGLGIVSIGMASAAPSVSIDPQSTTGLSPGDTFSIDVYVDSDTYNLKACKVDLTYDASALTATAVTPGTLLGSPALTEPGSGIQESGLIHYGIARTSGNTPVPVAGVFITVDFTVNSSAADGVYMLDLSNEALNKETNAYILGVVVNDGTATVDATPPEIQFVEPPTPKNNTEINVNYVNVTVNVTDNFNLEDTIAVLWWDGGNETMTNIEYAGTEARFYFNKTGLTDGTYSYRVYANDTAGNMGVSETRVVTISTKGAISGTISYACNETGIEGVTVALITQSGTEVDATTTNASGYYEFVDVTPGDYYVNASKTLFWLNSTYVTVGMGETVTVDMMLLLLGDLDNDCDVDWNDSLLFADAYGSSVGDPSYNVLADFDSDGDVDWDDYLAFADVYGT